MDLSEEENMATISAGERQEQEHDVRRDSVGINPKTRLTCYTPGCNGATIIWQGYMGVEHWDAAKKEFLVRHPTKNIVDEGHRG